MIKNMIVLVITIFVTALILIFQALRIPHLDIPAHASRSEKLLVLDEWFKLLHNKGKFNGAVLLSKEGLVLFLKSYGSNGTKISNQLNNHSSFNLASVSKQFTAMGIVILKDQSKLNYQNKVSDYIPELSFYEDITIQHLLHHTSGLPDYMKLAVKYKSNADVFTTSEMISLYQKHQPQLNFQPGKKFQYSNTGYVLLAEIIARVSGRSFDQFMAENIFIPLNMNDSQVFNLRSENQPSKQVYGYAYKYWLFGGQKEVRDLNYFDGVAGDGGIYSSAHDLNIWHEALRDGILISHETYKQAYLPVKLDNGSNSKYGFGWFINGDGSVEHSGGWQGFSSYIYRNINNDDLIVILDNSSNTLRVNSIGFRFNSIGLNLKKVIGIL